MKKVISTIAFLAVGAAQAGNIFQQDFAYGGGTTDYETGGPASGSLFTDIGNNADGTIAITSNQLVIGTPQVTSTANYDAGWGVTGLTIASGDIMRFEVEVGFDITTGTGDFGPMGAITFGDYNGTYSTYPHDSNKFTTIGLRRAGGTQMRFEPVNGTNFDVTYGDTNTLTIFMNDTGVAKTYVGPDSLTYNLSVSNLVDVNTDAYVQGSYAIWIGNTIMGDDLAAPTYVHAGAHNTSSVLDTVMLYANGDPDVGIETTFDNFSIASIPEPSTLALALIALGGLTFFRRRRG